MEAEEFIKIYEYLKNEHEEEMAERYEEVMDVQNCKKSEKCWGLRKKNCRSEKKKGCERSDKNTRGCVCQKWNSLLFVYGEKNKMTGYSKIK